MNATFRTFYIENSISSQSINTIINSIKLKRGVSDRLPSDLKKDMSPRKSCQEMIKWHIKNCSLGHKL